MAARQNVTPLNATSYTIEPGVPISPAGTGSRPTPLSTAMRALHKASIGDSFFAPLTHKHARQSISVCAKRVAGASGWFTAQKQDGGFRVWKTAEPATGSEA